MKPNQKKIIIAYCFGESYQKYIPLFIYSITDIFSDVDVLVVTPGILNKKIKKRIINCKNKERIILIENYMPIKNFVYEDLSSLVSKNQFYRFLRYIIEKKYFEGYSDAYIGDVDICYLRKLNSNSNILFNRENSISISNNLSFNNIARIDLYGDLTYRLGGLHYIRVDEYYREYGEIINKIQNDKRAFIELINKAKNNLSIDEYLRDEHLLFAMLIDETKINMLSEKLLKNKREIYGMHLGPLRNKKIVVNSTSLFGKNINNKMVKVLLNNLFQLLFKNKLYYFLYDPEIIRLYYYWIRLNINNNLKNISD